MTDTTAGDYHTRHVTNRQTIRKYLTISGSNNPPKEKGLPQPVTPTDKMTVGNPYLLRKSVNGTQDCMMKPGNLVKLMVEYMTTITNHNQSHSQPENVLWKSWLTAGLNNPNITVHQLAKIVKYPNIKDKTLKMWVFTC